MPINKLVIVSYLNFLRLNEKTRQILSKSDDFLVSINKEEYISLSIEEKNKLTGVALTDEQHNVEIIEHESLKKEVPAQNLEFNLKDIQSDIKVLVQSFKEKHQKQSKPYCPKNILNKFYNSKKKGGR